VVLNFNQRNWEIFGNFFACVNSTKFCYFLGKICKYLDITELGKKKKKKKKKKTCYCISLTTRTPISIICRNTEIFPKKCFFQKKKNQKICEGKKIETIWNPKEYSVFPHGIFKIKN
jgi:hypothetical protein